MERGEFEELVREHWGLIQSVARRFASGADLADVCQEVVLVAWRRREQLREPSGFGAWVSRIALNLGRAHCRRREGRLGPMLGGDATAPDPAQEVVDRCALEAVLSELSHRERLTLEAHHVLGWPLADISSALDEPVGTTKARLSRARAKLRNELPRAGWMRLGRSEEEQR